MRRPIASWTSPGRARASTALSAWPWRWACMPPNRKRRSMISIDLSCFPRKVMKIPRPSARVVSHVDKRPPAERQLHRYICRDAGQRKTNTVQIRRRIPSMHPQFSGPARRNLAADDAAAQVLKAAFWRLRGQTDGRSHRQNQRRHFQKRSTFQIMITSNSMQARPDATSQ